VELDEVPTDCKYTLPDGRSFSFFVPCLSEKPKIAFASCNDLQDRVRVKSVLDKTVVWNYMESEHELDPYHLLVMGGDQVYADPVFDACPETHLWLQVALDKDYGDEKWGIRASDTVTQKLHCFYFHLYPDTWSQGNMPNMLARIPSIMTWDDHDIFDGWGSYDPKKLASPFAQSIFEVAKYYFFLYQMCGDLTNVINKKHPNGPFNQGTELTGGVGLLLLDLRAERVFDRVISDKTWVAIENWLTTATELKRLFIVSSVPVVYPHSDIVISFLSKIGNPGHLVDDARDHWIDKIHK